MDAQLMNTLNEMFEAQMLWLLGFLAQFCGGCAVAGLALALGGIVKLCYDETRRLAQAKRDRFCTPPHLCAHPERPGSLVAGVNSCQPTA